MAAKQHAEGGHWGRDAIKIALTDRIYSPKLHSLLEPITRRHPFELLVGDYLTLPKAQGYNTVGVYLDTFSQHIWAFKYKSTGTAKTTVNSLSQIFRNFTASETFMSDGGRHFNNTVVQEFCAKWNCKAHVVAAYSPWINGLVEGTNKILLHVLKRLCAPNHLDDAITALNHRILPALKFSPKELLSGRSNAHGIRGTTAA